MARFTTGEFVELNGILGELIGGAIGKVVSVVANKHGISALDEYTITFEDSRRLLLWGFQLTPVGLTNRAIDHWDQERSVRFDH